MEPRHIGKSVIGPWYAGKSVLVTGATGFLGKVLVEKLIRSCPELRNIYLLVRPKRGEGADQRLKQIIDAPLFDDFRTNKPDVLKKLTVISGDITQPELGISPSDMAALVNNVSLVFHSAATVRFDEVLKLAVDLNILGTKRVVQLCRQLYKLEALVHISTAFCYCDKKEVFETVYPPSVDVNRIVRCAELLDSDLLDLLTPKIIGNSPNTYTFTKAIAEHVLVESAGNLPTAIVRPSIVTAAVKEPFPGWIDSLNGPTGLFIGANKGVIRTVLCHRDIKADIIPVDIVANLIIAVGWYTATSRPNNILVYNCTTGKQNPIKWGEIERLGLNCFLKHPYSNALWYPGGSFKNSKAFHLICTKLFHTLPAYLIDLASFLVGKKPRMVKIYKKTQKVMSSLEFFTTKEWEFSNDNVVQLFSLLNDCDKNEFNFDVKTINWAECIENYVLGIGKYILKDDFQKAKMAKSHLKILYVLNLLSQAVVFYFILRIILQFRCFVARLFS